MMYATAPLRPGPSHRLGPFISTKQVIHISDITAEQALRRKRSAAHGHCRIRQGADASGVPMLKENELIGAILIYRQEVRPFTDKQIELVEELCRPGRHRHREHTAAQRTARIAGAADRDIGGAEGHQHSPASLEPVFSAMLANATRICEAKFGTLYLCEGPCFSSRRSP